MIALASGSADPWLFLTLLGGFCYFDANKVLIQTNALTLDKSPHVLHLVGPYKTADDVAQWMENSGRLAPVTLKQLRDGGFQRFGWVLPDEQPGGHPLSTESVSLPGGAFAYRTKDGASIFYIVLMGDQSTSGASGPAALAKVASSESAAIGFQFGSAFGAIQKLWDDSNVKQAERMLARVDATRADPKRRARERRWHNMLRMLLIAAPTVSALLLLLLAFVEELIFRIFASFTWFVAFTYISWTMLHSTAMFSSSP